MHIATFIARACLKERVCESIYSSLTKNYKHTVLPTMPIFSRAATRKLTSSRTRGRSARYRMLTERNSTAPSLGHDGGGLCEPRKHVNEVIWRHSYEFVCAVIMVFWSLEPRDMRFCACVWKRACVCLCVRVIVCENVHVRACRCSCDSGWKGSMK